MRRVLSVLVLALGLAAPAVAQTAEDGYAAYDAGDYAKARTILLPLAEAGDPKAMNAVGLLYAEGKAFSRDRITACDWYEKAALSGYASAQGNFASCFEHADGRPKDIVLAISWNERAARQGDLESQIDLIRLYHKTNPELARHWGQKAVETGSITARLMMEEFGFAYSGPRPSLFEKLCYVVMVGVARKDRNYCDPVNASRAAPPP